MDTEEFNWIIKCISRYELSRAAIAWFGPFQAALGVHHHDTVKVVMSSSGTCMQMMGANPNDVVHGRYLL